MKNRNELDRRNFLKSLMVGTGAFMTTPMEIYLSNVMLHFLQRANALAADDLSAFADKKFIHLSMIGGAPRWYWDQVLRPNGNDDMGAHNSMLITKFNVANGEIQGGDYETVKIGDHHLPHMWSGLVPTPSGSAPMSNLAKHLLSIRGIDLQADGHDGNRFKQTMVASGISLLGLVSEQAKTPIPATAFIAGRNFYYSKKGIGLVESSSNTPLADFMNPFLGGQSLQSVSNSSFDASIDRVLAIMSAKSVDKHRFLPVTYDQRVNAKILLKKDFGNLQSIFNSLQQKYENLISRSFGDVSLALTGVEDVYLNSHTNDPKYVVNNGDQRFTVPGDLRSLTDSSTGIVALSSSMAVAEYMVTQGFSSSVSVASGDILNANSAGGVYTSNQAPTGPRTHVLIDCHDQGAYANLILQTRTFRAHSACLYELINQLKAVRTSSGNLFDQTSIAVTSEFSRSPRTDGSGSDHGFSGTNYAIYSGRIHSPIVVGNIGDHSAGYAGKWAAAPIPELNNRVALMGNVASSFATLLDLKSPTPNDASFVYVNNGVAYPAFPKGPKNV